VNISQLKPRSEKFGEDNNNNNNNNNHIKNYQRDALKIIYSSNIITPLHVSRIKYSSSGGQSRT